MRFSPLLVALVALFGACSSGDSPLPLAEATIGAAGGVLALPDGSASLTVPAGALGADVAFRIDRGQISIVPGAVDVGPALLFSPDRQGFAAAAEVLLSFVPELVASAVDPDELRVGFRDAAGQVRGLVPQHVDPGLGRVTVETTGLGVFWVVAPDVVSGADLFPLNDGDSYRYDSGLILTVARTAAEPNFEPRPVAKVTFTRLGQTTGLYLDDAGSQLRQLGAFDSSYSQERFDSSVLWIDAHDSIGAVRPIFTTYLGFRPFGSPIVGYTGLAEVTTEIAQRVSVTTPLGAFDTVRVPVTTVFSTTEPMLGEEYLEFWFAPGIGPVQIRFGRGQTPVRLVTATVGGQPVSGS